MGRRMACIYKQTKNIQTLEVAMILLQLPKHHEKYAPNKSI
jgi:hypothetical protein